MLEVIEDDAGRADRQGRVLGPDRTRERDPEEVLEALLPADGIEPIFLDVGRNQQLRRRKATSSRAMA